MPLYYRSTLLLAVGLLALSPLTANEDPAEIAARGCDQRISLPEQPRLRDYDDYDRFLVEAMEYKHLEEARRQHRQECPELYRRTPMVKEAPEPEDLEEAVARSDEIRERRGEATHDRTTADTTPLTREERDRLSEQYLIASLENLQEDVDPQTAGLMLLRIAEAMDDPDRDITREELRRVYEDARARAEFVFPLRDPRGLARITGEFPLFIYTREDGSEKIVSTIYASMCSDCPAAGVHFD